MSAHEFSKGETRIMITALRAYGDRHILGKPTAQTIERLLQRLEDGSEMASTK